MDFTISLFSVVFLYIQAAGLRAAQVLSTIVTLVSALTIAFVFGWKLAFLLMIAVPILVFASYQQTLVSRRYQQRDSDLMDLAGKVRTVMILIYSLSTGDRPYQIF
jgi:predicted MFS family arabinose efflux permease